MFLERILESEEQAQGTPVVVIPHDSGKHAQLQASDFVALWATDVPSYIVREAAIARTQIVQRADELTRLIKESGIRHYLLVGIGLGATVAQAVAIASEREVRQLIVVDPAPFLSLTFSEQLVDLLERALPLGLPFRKRSAGFDPRPYLHRIRCPTLVVSGYAQGIAGEGETNCLLRKIPNSWPLRATAADGADEATNALCRGVRVFIDSPARRPQRQRQTRVSPVSRARLVAATKTTTAQ